MKNKLTAMTLSAVILASGVASFTANADTDAMEEINLSGFGPYPAQSFYDDIYSLPVDYSLWNDFLKYDLRITDYDSLTDEQKNLCKYIFETERSADQAIHCERARRILAGEDVGERITVDSLEGAVVILDPKDAVTVSNAVLCVPDIIHLDCDFEANEYWLDETGDERILFNMTQRVFCYVELIDEVTEENFERWQVSCIVENGRDVYFENYESSSGIVLGEIETENAKCTILYDGTIAYRSSLSKTSDVLIEETVIIPESVDGYPVSWVDGFYGTNVTDIQFPESLTKICDYAFEGCEYLTEITLNCPEATIGKRSFEMSGLETADITVKIIGENAFDNCTGLQTLKLNEGIESIEANAFLNCENLTEIIIPSTLKYIGQGAFSCTGINEITIPETVEIIGVYPDRVGATSGAIFYYPATDPLTDEPVCVFDSDCIINGWYNTEAHRYALEWGLKFNPMDEDIAYGDTNLDGEVNIADMVLLQSYLKGNVSEIGYEADLLSDGIVDSFDMIKMRSNVLTQTAK